MMASLKEISENLKINTAQLKAETYALFLAYRHPSTPWYAKIFVGMVVAYAFSSIDLIPDFVPILGYLDDLILVPLGIKLALKMIPSFVMEECRIQARSELSNEKPTSWVVAVIIVIIWVVLTFIFFRTVRQLF
jgi:uncharacterized membrane protein YkvA (DUF1232 family)